MMDGLPGTDTVQDTGTSVEAGAVSLLPKPRPEFVETPMVRDLTGRALAFLNAGFPVHFRGPAGTGKTTLALHVAAQLGRNVMLISGDEELGTSDLVGGQQGYQYRKVVDRFIHSVLKYEETASPTWADHRLTTACREGCTLVYDEFIRSRPEANNVLLGVLEENLLVVSGSGQRNEAYLKVHPDFRAVFTSNSREYAGVYQAQDALSDRMVTIDVDEHDRESELAIVAAQASLDDGDAARIVDLVRAVRDSGECEQTPTLRACIMIAKTAAHEGLRPRIGEARFVQLCIDVLEARLTLAEKTLEKHERRRALLLDLIGRHCPNRRRRAAATRAPKGAKGKGK